MFQQGSTLEGICSSHKGCEFFFHPDFTVGFGFSPNLPRHLSPGLADFYRRSGITPCPEELLICCAKISLFFITITLLRLKNT